MGWVPDSQNPLHVRFLKMRRDVGMLSGFMDMPPYVTRVAPGARDLATAAEDAPPTQFRPSFGLGKPAEAVAAHHLVSSGVPQNALMLCKISHYIRISQHGVFIKEIVTETYGADLERL